MTDSIVKVGKYTFKISDNTIIVRDEIYSRNFRIGGKIPDCVTVSIVYYQNNISYAYMSFVNYFPDCSLETPLDRGIGTNIMIKTLLNYIHRQLPSITEVKFEDKSNIECATEDDILKKGARRKPGTNVYPIELYYFSIAFNGETWYEKNFKARHEDINKHEKYRQRIQNVFYSTELKTSISFDEFRVIANPPIELLDELHNFYDKSNTYNEFFQSMPKIDRCRLVKDWLNKFMLYHLHDVFDNRKWIIELPIQTIGGNRKTHKKYYLPRSKLHINNQHTFKDFGI